MKRVDVLAIAVLFYAGWFGAAALASTKHAHWSLLFPLIMILYLLARRQLRRSHCYIAGAIATVGVIFDFLQIRIGFVELRTDEPLIFPLWLLAIWIMYSCSMIVLGPFVKVPVRWMMLAGGIMGPLSYKSGEFFGVLTFATPVAFLAYALFWSVMFPATVVISKRYT